MKRLHQYSRASRFRIRRLLREAGQNETRDSSDSSDEEINVAPPRHRRNIREECAVPPERIDAEISGNDVGSDDSDVHDERNERGRPLVVSHEESDNSETSHASFHELRLPGNPNVAHLSESDHSEASDNSEQSVTDSDISAVVDVSDASEEDYGELEGGGPQFEIRDDEDIADQPEEDYGWDRDDDVHIYDGAPINLGESMLAILAFYLRHNISLASLTDLLTLINMHCKEEGNRFPKSAHAFKIFFANIQFPIKRHYYCSVCFQSVEEAGAPCQINHGTKTDFFIQISVVPQLKALYRRPGFREQLNYKFNREKVNPANIEDIYDGLVYKNLSRNGNILSNPSNIALMWNTDGVSIFKSAKSEIWPFYLTIQNLSYNNRTKLSNVLLAGLWFGRSKPSQATFLQPIRDDLLTLRRGINVSYGNNPINQEIIRGIVVCGTADLPAKANFLNFKCHNARHGCVKCKIQSVNIRRGLNIYPFRGNLQLRTQGETHRHAREALTIPIINGARQDVFGVKGPTMLSTFVYRCVETAAVDEMHCVYAGLMKALLGLWFESTHRDETYSLSAHKDLVNSRLLSIKPPCYVQRLTRKLDDVKYWKAHEMKSFLFYYSVAVLGDLMNDLYRDHHLMLVLGVYLLNQRSVSAEHLDLASELLTEYVSQFEDLYGRENLTCNLHQLLHLSDNVRNFGPLWVTSCFPFEDINGKLKKLVKGTRYSELQICSGVSMLMKFSELTGALPENSKSRHYVSAIFDRNRGIKTVNVDEFLFIVGKYVKRNILPALVLEALQNSNIPIGRNHYEFYRFMNYHIIHTSEMYERATKTKSCYVKFKYEQEECYGKVNRYLKMTNCDCVNFCANCEAQYYAVIRKHETRNDYTVFEDKPLHFMHTLLAETNVVAVPLRDVMCVCYFVNTGDRDEKYLIEPVNLIQAE